jgi:hypothetical protein
MKRITECFGLASKSTQPSNGKEESSKHDTTSSSAKSDSTAPDIIRKEIHITFLDERSRLRAQAAIEMATEQLQFSAEGIMQGIPVEMTDSADPASPVFSLCQEEHCFANGLVKPSPQMPIQKSVSFSDLTVDHDGQKPLKAASAKPRKERRISVKKLPHTEQHFRMLNTCCVHQTSINGETLFTFDEWEEDFNTIATEKKLVPVHILTMQLQMAKPNDIGEFGQEGDDEPRNSIVWVDHGPGIEWIIRTPDTKEKLESATRPRIMKRAIYNNDGVAISFPNYIEAIRPSLKPLSPLFYEAFTQNKVNVHDGNFLDHVAKATPSADPFSAPGKHVEFYVDRPWFYYSCTPKPSVEQRKWGEANETLYQHLVKETNAVIADAVQYAVNNSQASRHDYLDQQLNAWTEIFTKACGGSSEYAKWWLADDSDLLSFRKNDAYIPGAYCVGELQEIESTLDKKLADKKKCHLPIPLIHLYTATQKSLKRALR